MKVTGAPPTTAGCSAVNVVVGVGTVTTTWAVVAFVPVTLPMVNRTV